MQDLADYPMLTASFFTLEESLRPIGEFRVHVVPVLPLERTLATTFFPPPRRGADRYPRHKRARAEGGGPQEQQERIVDDAHEEDAGEQSGQDFVPALHEEDCVDDEGLGDFMDNEGAAVFQPMEPPSEEPDIANPSVAGPQAAEPPAPAPPAPPAAAPPPAAPRPPVAGRRGRGEATVILPTGRITFYLQKNVMEATCRNLDHGKCVLTRTVRCRAGTEGNPFPKGGRPLGFLAAWLCRAGCASKEEHWSDMHLSLEERVAGRQQIMEAEGGAQLLMWERARRPDEPEELETLEGLL